MSSVDKQTRLLTALLATPGCRLPPSVFLYGHRSTGKHTALRRALQGRRGPALYVNCVECYTPSLLFQLVLHELLHTRVTVNNMNGFVRRLQEALKDGAAADGVVVVLEKAERLRDVGSNGSVLNGMMRLQELTGLNLCCVLVSTIIWDKFTTHACLPRPIMVHFPQFNRSQLREILCGNCPSHVDRELFQNYIGIVIYTLYASCRNVSELKHMAMTNLDHYLKPIDDGTVEKTNVRALWKSVEPHLRAAAKQIFLREVVSSKSEAPADKCVASLNNGTSAGVKQSLPESAVVSDELGRLNAELPFYSKFLLIAAFLASYNPAKTDRRFFVVSRRKRGAKGRGAPRGARDMALLAGPRTFPLHRLLAIFYFIVEDRVTPTAHLYTQIMSLVSLRLLARVAASDNIDTCKLRCLTSLETSNSIAKSVDFELERYLYDFV